MKKTIFTLLSLCGIALGDYAPSGYTLVMGDEFDSGSLNSDNWGKFEYNSATSNWVQFMSRDDDMYVCDAEAGTLNLKARYGEYSSQWKNLNQGDAYASGNTFASGAIYTNLAFQYGYVEVRARMDSAWGLWPAIWLYTTDGSKGGEIDMLEHLNYSGSYYITTHGNNSYHTTCVSYEGSRADWHTYGMLWEENSITMYLDGRQVVQWTGLPTHDIEGNMFRLRLTQQIGGGWVGYSGADMMSNSGIQNNINNNYDDEGKLIDSDGKDFEIDYVRIYQKSDISSQYMLATMSLEDDSYAVVPEPATATLSLLALAALAARRRRA